MKKRWNKRSVWHGIKHTFVSVLVCAVVIGLPLLGFRQWHTDANAIQTSKATPLPAFKTRSIDKTSRPPQLFKEPLLSISFDDGWETTYTVAAPLLMKDGIHSTQYVVSGVIGDPDYLSLSQIKALQANGQEIGCHTVTHANLTKLSAKDLNYQLAGCKQYFAKHGIGTVKDFAAPYGATNPTVIAAISHEFRSERSTYGELSDGVDDSDINLPSNFDPHNIVGITVHQGTTVQQLKEAIDYTKAHNGWLVLTYHQADDPNSKYSLSKDSLKQQLDFLSSQQIRIVSVGQVIDNLPASR